MYPDNRKGQHQQHSSHHRRRGSHTGRPRQQTPPTPPINQPQTSPRRQTLTDLDAYRLGEQIFIRAYNPQLLQDLFPQGLDFDIARQIFIAALVQTAQPYEEREINAMWIGFAHQCSDHYQRDSRNPAQW